MRLDKSKLNTLVKSEQIENLTFDYLTELFLSDINILELEPDQQFQIDPRNGNVTIFNPNRGKRPHDNIGANIKIPEKLKDPFCAICSGKTTGILDVTKLSDGYTFINKNLYPVLTPPRNSLPLFENDLKMGYANIYGNIFGYHFLQWTSSIHQNDWHNMPLIDRIVVMKRLVNLEKYLLEKSSKVMPNKVRLDSNQDFSGFVSIFKNQGALVGGSLTHGHQQILLSNQIPPRILTNWRFLQQNGESFSSFMLTKNPTELLIQDYGTCVLVVPYFMPRPFDLMLIIKNTEIAHLHQLSNQEIEDLSKAWHNAIKLLQITLSQMDRDIAFNIITYNGPGAGLYFEFKPYSQEIGGLEHLGYYICNSNPQIVAKSIKTIIQEKNFF